MIPENLGLATAVPITSKLGNFNDAFLLHEISNYPF